MWFQYSQSWIYPVGLGLLSTTEGWTRWPPGLFQPKIILSFKLSFNVFNKTDLSSWLELVSDLLLVHTISLNIYSWKKRNPLRLNEFICKSCRKSCLIPNVLMSSCNGIHWSLTTECLQSMREMSVNIVDFDSSLIPKQSANLWLSRGHTCRQYPARCMLQLPGCPSVLM